MALRAGAIRFNTDLSQLEIYDGNQWTGILATSPHQQTGGTRAVLAGGYSPGGVNTMDFFNVDITGDAVDFGNLTTSQYYGAGFGSRTHGFVAGKNSCLLYTSPSPRDKRQSRMPSSA